MAPYPGASLRSTIEEPDDGGDPQHEDDDDFQDTHPAILNLPRVLLIACQLGVVFRDPETSPDGVHTRIIPWEMIEEVRIS